jgi:hypothetical protein
MLVELDKSELNELFIFYEKMRNVFTFAEFCWGLTPQKVKPEYEDLWKELVKAEWDDWERLRKEVKPFWFGTFNSKTQEWDWYGFKKGETLTWQQTLVFLGYQKALDKKAKPKITIKSGHGIGKSSSIAMLVLHYLAMHHQSQIACTAPTSNQIHDVLWKELSIWKNRIRIEHFKNLYDWKSEYLRIKDDPNAWFARAKTASKENPEALAGVHGEDVMLIADEASGIEDPIFDTAQGSLTNEDTIVIFISNPTRTSGYFYRTHNDLADQYQCFEFSSEDSPLVSRKWIEDRAIEYGGKDTERYGIRVKGTFPNADAVDDKGYVPLYIKGTYTFSHDRDMSATTEKALGVDPAGEGQDECVWYLRDGYKAIRLAKEKKSNSLGIATKTIMFMEAYDIKPENVIVDNFGEGANVSRDIAILSKGKYSVRAVNTGDTLDSDIFGEDVASEYINLRAYLFYESNKWLRNKGELVYNADVEKELPVLKFRRNIKGKIQIIDKLTLKKSGIPSPNNLDAFSLTFLVDLNRERQADDVVERIKRLNNSFDPHSVI